MKHLTKLLALAGITTLCLATPAAFAQGGPGGERGNRGERGERGNWDPAQMQQRMMEGVRERLEVKDDTEWKAIEPLVQKVMDLRREQMGAGMRGAFGGRGGGPGGGRWGGEAPAEETALRTAIESNASNNELKARMEAYRKAKAAKEAELKTAQDNLKKVLSTKQEATALQMGLVN